MTSAIAAVEAVPGRLRAMAAGGVRILDDSYNSNPRSVRAALLAAREVAERRGERLVVALGDMLELGEVAAAEHLAMLEAADRCGADQLILVGGETAKALALLPKPLATPNRSFADAAAAAAALPELVRAGDLLLVKGRAACAWSASSNSSKRRRSASRDARRQQPAAPAAPRRQTGKSGRPDRGARREAPQPPETPVNHGESEMSWSERPLVGILMGSKNDYEVMVRGGEDLPGARASPARRGCSRRTARRTRRSTTLPPPPARGTKALIAGAGGAAHLAGVLAAKTLLPVLGVPIDSSALQGLDALLAMVQMPKGIPVGDVRHRQGRRRERRALRRRDPGALRSGAPRPPRRLARGAPARGPGADAT